MKITKLGDGYFAFRLGPLCGSWWRSMGMKQPGPGLWFRLFGRGLHLQDAKGYRPMFSERYGYTTAIYIGRLRIKLLS